jgi:dipeptidyl aminopeptidase/acylaminoacyl peptidase
VSSAVVAGGSDEAVLQPSFAPDGAHLLYVSDSTGMGQLYRRDLSTGAVEQLTHGEGDIGAPAWNQGMRRFGVGPSSVVATEGVRGFDRLRAVSSRGDEPVDVAPYTSVAGLSPSPDGSRVAFVGSGGSQPPRVVVRDLAGGAIRVCKRADGEIVSPAALATPEALSWPSFDGELAHGLYYPPASDRFVGTGVPPLIVLIHGGPTSQVKAGWDPVAQFFATRGYGVLFPNYRGSTGYGRDYMLKLRRSWGVYDVQDAKSGAEYLAGEGRVDGRKLVIMGGSAGGYTVLQSLCDLPGFYTAGICMYGVSNQFTLAADTHKFEARYLDSMLGPLPEAAAVYRDRSPVFHAAKIGDPVAVFQGDIDRVVPRAQSDEIVASLRARGVPHEYHVYEGEGHGWRKAETIEQFYTAVERFLTQYVLFA